MTFKRDRSGNPKGRPSGIVDKRTKLRQLLEPYAEELITKAIKQALSGEPTALRLCIERLMPRIKEEPINFKLPDGDITQVKKLPEISAEVLRSLERQEITPEQAKGLFDAIKGYRETIIVAELAQKLSELKINVN